MFKTPYKSLYRIQNITEALRFEIKDDMTDMYLYLIDVYDVLLNAALGKEEVDIRQLVRQRMKLHEYMLKYYHKLHAPIPGRLYGYTHSMLLYVIILTTVELQHQSEHPIIPEHVHQYCIRHRLRMYEDTDTETWKLHTYLDMLDVISLRWKHLDPSGPSGSLQELLEIMWRVSAKFSLFVQPERKMDMEKYRDPVGKAYRANALCLVAGVSRYYWFHQTMVQYTKWREGPLDALAVRKIKDTNWIDWIENEKRHLLTRRFRDHLIECVWPQLLNFGDHGLGSHDQLGDTVSLYGTIHQRFPSALPTKVQQLCTYKDYDEIIKMDCIKEILHLRLIHAHFKSMYDVNFTKMFTVGERNIHKHIDAIRRSSVPVILNMYWKYYVCFRGRLYTNPEGTSVKHAFVLWLSILNKKCKGICFQKLDFNPTIELLFHEKSKIDNKREMGHFIDLEDE